MHELSRPSSEIVVRLVGRERDTHRERIVETLDYGVKNEVGSN